MSIGTEIEKFKITEIRFETNKQLSSIGVCLECGFSKALITAERWLDRDEEGEPYYKNSWRCWCPKCGHVYQEGEGRAEGTTYQIALFLYGRGEYMKQPHVTPTTPMPKTMAQNCWVCGEKLLDDGTAIWPPSAYPWFGLHRKCTPKTV